MTPLVFLLRKNARSSSRSQRVDSQQLFQTPSLRQKLKSFSTLYVKTPTVPNINCTLVVKHIYLPKLILDLEVVKRNCDQLQTLATSEQRSRTFLTDVDKQKRSADHLFKSYEALVNTEACLAKDVSNLEAKLVEAR